jgi:hypothetical protein
MFLFESTLPPPPTLIRRKTAQKGEEKKRDRGRLTHWYKNLLNGRSLP